MFRRWLLSMPEGQETNIDAPVSLAGWNDTNSVVLVGKGSLGIDPANPKPGDELDRVTRAYPTPVGKNGKHAWWIGPENHKARVNMAKRPQRPSQEGSQSALRERRLTVARTGPPLGKLDPLRGCLADHPKTAPDFQLNEAQMKSIRAALEGPAPPPPSRSFLSGWPRRTALIPSILTNRTQWTRKPCRIWTAPR